MQCDAAWTGAHQCVFLFGLVFTQLPRNKNQLLSLSLSRQPRVSQDSSALPTLSQPISSSPRFSAQHLPQLLSACNGLIYFSFLLTTARHCSDCRCLCSSQFLPQKEPERGVSRAAQAGRCTRPFFACGRNAFA